VVLTSKVAAAEPEVLPKVTRPAPKALAEVAAVTVPARIFSPRFVVPLNVHRGAGKSEKR
jgi:hypothetical protein